MTIIVETIFLPPGTTSWTARPGDLYADIHAFGPGGLATATGTYRGGGGGGYGCALAYALTAGQTYVVAVGAPGSGNPSRFRNAANSADVAFGGGAVNHNGGTGSGLSGGFSGGISTAGGSAWCGGGGAAGPNGAGATTGSSSSLRSAGGGGANGGSSGNWQRAGHNRFGTGGGLPGANGSSGGGGGGGNDPTLSPHGGHGSAENLFTQTSDGAVGGPGSGGGGAYGAGTGFYVGGNGGGWGGGAGSGVTVGVSGPGQIVLVVTRDLRGPRDGAATASIAVAATAGRARTRRKSASAAFDLHGYAQYKRLRARASTGVLVSNSTAPKGRTRRKPAAGLLSTASTAKRNRVRSRGLATGQLLATAKASKVGARRRLAAALATFTGVSRRNRARTRWAPGGFSTSGTAPRRRVRSRPATGGFSLVGWGVVIGTRHRLVPARGGLTTNSFAVVQGRALRRPAFGMLLTSSRAIVLGRKKTGEAVGSLSLNGKAAWTLVIKTNMRPATSVHVEYIAGGGQKEFEVPFGYISTDHVSVHANGIRYYIKEWLSPSRILLNSAPGQNAYVLIQRVTPVINPAVTFKNGAVLTEEDLNLAVRQLLYRQQELDALYDSTLLAAKVRIGELGGVGVTPEDATNQIVSMITASAVLDNFRQRVDELDKNAETILSQAIHNQNRHDHAAAVIQTEKTQRVTADEALAQQITVVAAQFQNNIAAITQGMTALSNADGAFAELFSLLGVKSPDGASFILDDARIKLSNGEFLTERLTGLDTRIGNVSAAIVNESTILQNAMTAQASQIATVNTTVGSLSASVSAILASVNGVAARAGIQLDVNGYVTGWVMNNDGTSGDMTIGVDVFRIVNRSNGSAIFPFVVEGGVVKINTAYITDLHADKITAGTIIADKMVQGTLTPGQFAMGAVGEATAFYDMVSVNVNSTASWVNVAAAALTPAQGMPIQGQFSAYCQNLSDNKTDVMIRVIRDDNTVIWGDSAGSKFDIRDGGSSINIPFFDTVSALRTTTYTLQARKASNSDVCRFANRLVWLQELSRLHFQAFTVNVTPGSTGPGWGPGGGGYYGGGLIP